MAKLLKVSVKSPAPSVAKSEFEALLDKQFAPKARTEPAPAKASKPAPAPKKEAKPGQEVVVVGTPSRYPPQSEDAHIGSNRLIRLGDAIAAGADPKQAAEKILSWGNKRVRQKLADGGHIDRRVGGSGWGGTGSGGQTPPGKGRTKKGTPSKGGKPPSDTRTTEDRLREIRERGERERAGKQGIKPAEKPEALPVSTRKPSGAMGIAATPPEAPIAKKALPSFAEDAGRALKGKAAEVKEGAEAVIPQAQAIKAAKGALTDRFKEVKALWNGGRKDLAVKKALLTGWPTLELQDDAINWLEKRLSK